MSMVGVELLILRGVFGLAMAAHGSQKLFGWFGGAGLKGWTGHVEAMGFRPAPWWALVAALSEFGGGLLVALGLLTPVAAAAVIGAMLIATVVVHLPKGFFNANGGFELPLLMAVAVGSVAITGPGSISGDPPPGPNLPQPPPPAVPLAGGLASPPTRPHAPTG